MPTVSLSKDLKIKNRVAGEISRLSKLTCRHNSYREDVVPQYDTAKLLERIMELTNALVTIKLSIILANADVHYHRLRLMENR